MSKRGKITTFAVLIVATIAFIIFNSCQDPEASWEMSNAAGSLFSTILHGVHNIAVALFGWTGNSYITDYGAFVRKMAHILEYAALGAECAALGIVVGGKKASPWLWMAGFLPLMIAIIDEFIQGFFGRTSLVSDVLIDFSGACIGILFAIIVAAIVRKVAARKR